MRAIKSSSSAHIQNVPFLAHAMLDRILSGLSIEVLEFRKILSYQSLLRYFLMNHRMLKLLGNPGNEEISRCYLSTMPQYQCAAIRCHINQENITINFFSFEDLNETHLRERF